jgi:hypothetical protein
VPDGALEDIAASKKAALAAVSLLVKSSAKRAKIDPDAFAASPVAPTFAFTESRVGLSATNNLSPIAN